MIGDLRVELGDGKVLIAERPHWESAHRGHPSKQPFSLRDLVSVTWGIVIILGDIPHMEPLFIGS